MLAKRWGVREDDLNITSVTETITDNVIEREIVTERLVPRFTPYMGPGTASYPKRTACNGVSRKEIG